MNNTQPQTTKQAVNGPAGHAPIRPPNSVRRTSTIDMTWPEGRDTQLLLQGSARDAITDDSSEPPTIVAEASVAVGIGDDRTIENIRAKPEVPGIEHLVGCRGGGYLRRALQEHVPAELEGGTPMYLILDDVSGTSLIAGFAWSRWDTEWRERGGRRPIALMEGVCLGFAPGSTALNEEEASSHRVKPVVSLVNPEDPQGWHDLTDLPEVSMRRARRIDVWRDGDVIRIDSGFQDSASEPGGGRVAIHEYRLEATADSTTFELLTVSPDPRILPFNECPGAVATSQTLVGVALGDLRQEVLARLAKTNGCTHLNDALRALAEVPVLLEALDKQLASTSN